MRPLAVPRPLKSGNKHVYLRLNINVVIEIILRFLVVVLPFMMGMRKAASTAINPAPVPREPAMRKYLECTHSFRLKFLLFLLE